MGRIEEALPYSDRALAWTTTHAPQHWTHEFAKALRGAALAGAGDVADGEALLVDGYTALRDRREEIDALERERILESCRQRLVRLYEAWDKPDEAVKWK